MNERRSTNLRNLTASVSILRTPRFVAYVISVATIRRIESQEGPLAGFVSTLVKIQVALEHAGIQFIDDDELGGFGVRMAKKKRKR